MLNCHIYEDSDHSYCQDYECRDCEATDKKTVFQGQHFGYLLDLLYSAPGVEFEPEYFDYCVKELCNFFQFDKEFYPKKQIVKFPSVMTEEYLNFIQTCNF